MRKITIQLARTRGVVFLLLFLIGGIFVRTSLPWGATKAEAGCGGASEIVFTGSPGNTVLNSTFTLQVQVLDGCGELLTTDNGRSITVSILSGPSGAVLSGTLTRTTSSGVASFTGLSLNKGGTYVIAAGTDGLASTQTTSFSVFGDPAKLGISAVSPSAVRFGNPVSFTVTVQDADGATVFDSNGREISLAFGTHADGGVIDEGGLSQTSDGVASFSTTILGSVGTYSLIASSDGLTSIESSTFTVYGNAHHITPTILQSSVNINSNFTLTWEVRDSGNNKVADDSTTAVTVALASNPTNATLTVGGSNPRTPSSGEGIFTALSIDKAGTYTLQLTASGLTTGVTNSITVVDPNASSGGGNSGGSSGSFGAISSGGSGFVGGAPPPAAWFPVPSPVNPNIVEQTKKNLLTVLANNFSRDLFIGMRSESVRLLQMFLVTKDTGPHARTLKNHGLTTYFGPLTESALKEFQKANNVPATGYFGPKTRAAAKGQ